MPESTTQSSKKKKTSDSISSSLSSAAITTLALVRAGVGLGFLVTPQLACRTAGLGIHPQATLLPRLVGVREIALAVLLWSAFSAQRRQNITNSDAGSTTVLRHILWANLLVDLTDVVSCAIIVFIGTPESSTAVLHAGAGIMGSALAVFGLRGIR
jgi:hypothetical protein